MGLLRLSILFFVLVIPLPSSGYRILGLFPYNAPSHFSMAERLMKGLAERGHRVDVVGHFPLKKSFPNYNDIIDLRATDTLDRRNNLTYDSLKEYLRVKLLARVVATELGVALCKLMSHPKFTELVKNPPKDPPYDLVIAEIFGSHCYLAMGQHLNVPVVGIVTSAMWPWVNDMVANPDEPAFVPQVFLGSDEKMNFWQRMENAVTLLYEKWQFDHYSAAQDDAIKKHIGCHAPSVRDAERNVSLILVNSHFSLNGVRPFTTAVVEVGGLHIPTSANPLPNDLEQWLDESKDGFVYISFGAMTKIESFPEETLTAIYRSVAKLAPIRVLMKIAKPDELPSGLPKNVLTHPWIPQLAVLRHKNIRTFMTHGGLMGTQEAVDCGVPMVGVPLFADQTQNIQMYVKRGIAVYLHHEELTEKNIDAAFNAVLRDPSYMKAAKKLSTEFRDRPMSALDTAIFWTEYVVRHGGTSLRSPAMDLTWWQVALLDVYGALLLATVLVVYFLTLIINKLFNQPYCPALFDGWSCWPDTPAGTTVFTPCPYFITGFDEARLAHKDCEVNGTWFKHPESQQVWSNYTTCVNLEDLGWQQQLNVIYETGYAISLVALLLSLAILTYFRSLRCARITLHMNLFASFAVNNALWLIWYGAIVADAETALENGIGCRLLHVILHYFLLTNYAWMLCEGFYLHTILVSAFTSEHKLVKWLMCLGWPTPAIIVTIYATLRATSSDLKDTLQCWIDEGNYTSVFLYPVGFSTLLNLLFLCNIVRVLLTKLRAGPAIGSKPSRAMLQAFRATLLLVPLLGLHYLVIPFRPPKGHSWERAYEVVSAITASFQGLCVAILFCFCNGEVITQFKRKWEGTAFARKRANSCTATTVSVRWRERKRCDYQSAAAEDPQESAGSNVTAAHRGSSNHLQVLIKRNDSANDFGQYQSQC